jgi:hypothetical protein
MQGAETLTKRTIPINRWRNRAEYLEKGLRAVQHLCRNDKRLVLVIDYILQEKVIYKEGKTDEPDTSTISDGNFTAPN